MTISNSNLSLQEQHDNAAKMLPLAEEKLSFLQQKARCYVEITLNMPLNSPAFHQQVMMIHSLANAAISQAAQHSNHLLQQPLNSCQNTVNCHVSDSLFQLRTLIEGLSPTHDNIFAPKKLFGFIPWGSQVKDYFLRYENAQNHLNAIIEHLLQSKDALLRDNVAIEEERANLWALMLSLRQYAMLGKYLDEALCTEISRLMTSDIERATELQKQLLFYIRQKQTDILTQLAISMQSYLALDVIYQNNLELIKGINRATTSTISALRTAVITAQALTRQKLVLNQINALNETTGNLIAQTAQMMNEQAAQIQQKASSANIDLEQLKMAFSHVYSALETLDNHKVKSLDAMAEAIALVRQESKTAEQYLRKYQQDDLPLSSALEIN